MRRLLGSIVCSCKQSLAVLSLAELAIFFTMAAHHKLPLTGRSLVVLQARRSSGLQAMNGSRSSELAAADVILDSDTNNPLQEALPLSTTSHAMPTPDQQAVPSHMLSDPGMQHADVQALPNQASLHDDADRPVYSHQPRLSADAELPLYAHQPRLSGDASAHHRPAASWQQSEASMQEIVSTSGSSSDSGMPSLTSFQAGVCLNRAMHIACCMSFSGRTRASCVATACTVSLQAYGMLQPDKYRCARLCQTSPDTVHCINNQLVSALQWSGIACSGCAFSHTCSAQSRVAEALTRACSGRYVGQ